jgi:hypothetical protein
MRVLLLMSMPDVTPHTAKREWEAPNLGIASIAGNVDRRHQGWMTDLRDCGFETWTPFHIAC